MLQGPSSPETQGLLTSTTFDLAHDCTKTNINKTMQILTNLFIK